MSTALRTNSRRSFTQNRARSSRCEWWSLLLGRIVCAWAERAGAFRRRAPFPSALWAARPPARQQQCNPHPRCTPLRQHWLPDRARTRTTRQPANVHTITPCWTVSRAPRLRLDAGASIATARFPCSALRSPDLHSLSRNPMHPHTHAATPLGRRRGCGLLLLLLASCWCVAHVGRPPAAPAAALASPRFPTAHFASPPVPSLAVRPLCRLPLAAAQCGAGTYDLNGACVLCPSGTVKTGTGDSIAACLTCPAGSECPSTMAAQPCAQGTYALGGATACVKCPAGYECPSTGSAPSQCAAGSYAPPGQTAVRVHTPRHRHRPLLLPVWSCSPQHHPPLASPPLPSLFPPPLSPADRRRCRPCCCCPHCCSASRAQRGGRPPRPAPPPAPRAPRATRALTPLRPPPPARLAATARAARCPLAPCARAVCMPRPVARRRASPAPPARRALWARRRASRAPLASSLAAARGRAPSAPHGPAAEQRGTGVTPALLA